ncbi:unnamed protein product [Tetraodon nigroviridis]|uniref:(spotted green pufferfish) hypothetical protein n=1 Tax=Tetraodon nigroviridis TaxID=99883 RepID=Q4SQT0_TETNG|nr:unnamed protein product [Tetraodon nigroviridis]
MEARYQVMPSMESSWCWCFLMALTRPGWSPSANETATRGCVGKTDEQLPLNQHPYYFPPSSGRHTSTQRQGQLSPVAPLGQLPGSGTATPTSAKEKTRTM